jgi:hypothetical protein
VNSMTNVEATSEECSNCGKMTSSIEKRRMRDNSMS